MNIVSFFSLAMALFVSVAIPGPGVSAVLARSLASGFRPAVNVIFGIVIGDLIFVLFAVFGLSMIAQNLGELFIIIKIAGGIYLFILGLKIWFSEPASFNSKKVIEKQSSSGNIVSGLLVTLSNPKAILFYCSFLPAFMDLSKITISDFIFIVILVTSMLSLVLVTYAYLASRARQFFSSRVARKRLSRSAGGIMIATGAFIAVKS